MRDGTIEHPDVIDNYVISHCSIDVCYVDDKIRNITGSVAIDAWDACSKEIAKRR